MPFRSSYALTSGLVVLVAAFAMTGYWWVYKPEFQTITPSSLRAESNRAAALPVPTSDGELRFEPEVVVSMAYPPLESPEPISIEQADRLIDRTELVLGVTIADQSLAVPVNMLTGPNRTIINTTLNDVPIALTWCQLCHHAVVFHRRIDERELIFQVSGMLWHNSLVMQDTETLSLWSQSLGRAMSEPLMGTMLTMEPCALTTWEQWKLTAPTTQAIVMSRTRDDLTQDYYDLRGVTRFVLGALSEQRAQHWPLESLRAASGINDLLYDTPDWITLDPKGVGAQMFDRRCQGMILWFEPQAGGWIDRTTGSTWNPVTGQAIEGRLAGQRLDRVACTLSLEDAWLTFHPASRLAPEASDP